MYLSQRCHRPQQTERWYTNDVGIHVTKALFYYFDGRWHELYELQRLVVVCAKYSIMNVQVRTDGVMHTHCWRRVCVRLTASGIRNSNSEQYPRIQISPAMRVVAATTLPMSGLTNDQFTLADAGRRHAGTDCRVHFLANIYIYLSSFIMHK